MGHLSMRQKWGRAAGCGPFGSLVLARLLALVLLGTAVGKGVEGVTFVTLDRDEFLPGLFVPCCVLRILPSAVVHKPKL